MHRGYDFRAGVECCCRRKIVSLNHLSVLNPTTYPYVVVEGSILGHIVLAKVFVFVAQHGQHVVYALHTRKKEKRAKRAGANRKAMYE